MQPTEKYVDSVICQRKSARLFLSFMLTALLCTKGHSSWPRLLCFLKRTFIYLLFLFYLFINKYLFILFYLFICQYIYLSGEATKCPPYF